MGTVRAGGNLPTAKPAPVAAAPVVAAGAAVATAAVVAAESKPKAAAPVASVPVPALSKASFQDAEPEGSTTLTTVLAGVLALLTWGTAGILLYNIYGS